MPQVIDGVCHTKCDNQIFHLMEKHFTIKGNPVELTVEKRGNLTLVTKVSLKTESNNG